jgi:hypothetical protein
MVIPKISDNLTQDKEPIAPKKPQWGPFAFLEE